jgi:hypothetical protein
MLLIPSCSGINIDHCNLRAELLNNCKKEADFFESASSFTFKEVFCRFVSDKAPD